MTPVFSLPVLMITCPGVNCLVLMEGLAVGESGDCPAMPIRPDGPCYISLYPLEQPAAGYLLPVQVKLELRAGQLITPLQRGVEAFCDENGLIELSITVPYLPPTPLPAVPRALSRVEVLSPEGGRYLATLYEENGMRLAVEDPARDVIISHIALNDLGEGRLAAHPFTTPPAEDVILTGAGPYGDRFLLLSARDGYQPAIDDNARGDLLPGAIQTTENLGDLCGHQCRRLYRMEQGRLSQTVQYGYFTGQRRALAGAQRCIGMCQCLKLGLYEEAMDSLTPAARRGLRAEDLAGFLGAYHDIRPLYREREDQVLLTLSYPEREGCYRLRRYRFAIRDGLVDDIREEDD